MCIAILNLGAKITKKQFNQCAKSNPDGFGMLYTENNELKVYKEMTDFVAAYEMYEKIYFTGSPVVLHFRIGTSGKVNEENCHPFMVNRALGFVHNGILSLPGDLHYSDTYYFNELILKKLPRGFLYNSGINELLQGYAKGSKLVFLDNLGRSHIINEQAGHWVGKNWFSNYSYEPFIYTGRYFDKYLKDDDKYLTDAGEDMKDVCYYCGDPLTVHNCTSDWDICTDCEAILNAEREESNNNKPKIYENL